MAASTNETAPGSVMTEERSGFDRERNDRLREVTDLGPVADQAQPRPYFFTISRSSTSKTSVAPGLIVGGDPRSP